MGDLLRTQAQEAASQSSEGLLCRIYKSFATKSGSQTIKRLLEIKENQIAHINKFRAFLRLGRGNSLGSLKSSL